MIQRRATDRPIIRRATAQEPYDFIDSSYELNLSVVLIVIAATLCPPCLTSQRLQALGH